VKKTSYYRGESEAEFGYPVSDNAVKFIDTEEEN